MVTMVNYVPLRLNKFDSRCDDRRVTVTVGANRGFEVLCHLDRPSQDYVKTRYVTSGSQRAAWTTIGPYRGRCCECT
jgi:hypothetical protein